MRILMVSCIARTTTGAMTIMPFLLVIQLIFAGSVFPLNKPLAQKLANFTISNWGINAINIAADYNSQPSSIFSTAIDTMNGSDDELMVKIRNVMEIPEVKDKVEYYAASNLQEPKFTYSKSNLLRCWGILSLFWLGYALVGLLFLELIDRDKR